MKFTPGLSPAGYAVALRKELNLPEGIEVTKSCKECIQEDLRGTEDHELPVGIKLVFSPVPE